MKLHILTPVAAATLAVLSLSACGKSEPEVVGGVPDPMAEQLANAAPAKLPPMVKATKQYRCKDNSLAFVSFMSDDTTASIKTEKDGAPTALTAAAPGEPFVGEGGFKVTGNGATAQIAVPGKGEQACKS